MSKCHGRPLKFFKNKNPSPVKETGFPLQLTLATPLPSLICEIRPEVLRPTFSGGLPLTGSVGTFQ